MAKKAKKTEEPKVFGELVTPDTGHEVLIVADDEGDNLFKLEPGELEKALGPTRAKELLAKDGLPVECMVSKEEREEAWKKNPPKEVVWDTGSSKNKEVPPDVAAFKEAEEKRKANATKVRIEKMKAKAATPDPKTHTWDARNNRWIKKDGGPAEAPKVTARQAAANLRAAKAKGEKRVNGAKAKPAKKAAAPKAPRAARQISTEGHSEIAIACGTKSPNRMAALNFLNKTLGKQRLTDDIMKAVYGDAEASTNAFHTVMKSLVRDITNKKAKFEIKQEKSEKGITYGLYEKS